MYRTMYQNHVQNHVQNHESEPWIRTMDSACLVREETEELFYNMN